MCGVIAYALSKGQHQLLVADTLLHLQERAQMPCIILMHIYLLACCLHLCSIYLHGSRGRTPV
jgi:hypothetical protein